MHGKGCIILALKISTFLAVGMKFKNQSFKKRENDELFSWSGSSP
jgi:hypothetical protein